MPRGVWERPASPVITEKTCTSCGETKALECFGPDKNGRGGVKSKCRECRKGEWRAYYKNHHLMSEYGITLDQYKAMLAAQHGRCAICRRHQDELARDFAVDHDHETGVVRGLLCISCNRGLGYLGDDLDRLMAAVAYLMEAGER